MVTSPIIFADGFESGNLSAWDGSVTDSGDLSVSTQAALQGTYGLKAVIDDNASIYVVDDGPEAAVRYQASFSFSFGSLSMGSLDVFKLFQGYDASGAAAVYIEVKKSAANTIRISASVLDDSGRAWSMTSDNLSQVVTHTVQIEWKAATAPGANDGNLALWVDGQPAFGFYSNGIDNDTRRIDTVRFGAVEGIDSGTYGWYALDKFKSDATQVQRTRIDYTYDPLNRLTEASYDDSRQFDYDYDAVGNVLFYTQTTDSERIVTSYNYDSANQLMTAQMSNDTIVWEYDYDANGSLTEILPDGRQADGARRYTYNSAGYLIGVELHDGRAYQPRTEISYNGLGQRRLLTAYEAGVSLTTYYAVDSLNNARPLAATAAGQTTYYTYGHGPIAELTDAWSYSLVDGTGTPRQSADASGRVTATGRYTPWGEVLDYSGEGQFTWGYFGGLLDAATGLLYLGNGQYYDPKIGRFLTRQAQPGQLHPYIPGRGDPTGLLIGPLALLVLARGRKKGKKSDGKAELLLVLGLVLLAGGMLLTSCENPPIPRPPDYPGEPPKIPSGEDQSQYCGSDRTSQCWGIIEKLQSDYPYLDLETEIKPEQGYWWKSEEVQTIYDRELQPMDDKVSERLVQVFDEKEIPVRRVQTLGVELGGIDICARANPDEPIKIYNAMYWEYGNGHCKGALIHEIAHKWDEKEDYELSKQFEAYIGASTDGNTYDPGDEAPSLYRGELTRKEDFAQSFAEYTYPQYYQGTKVLNGNLRWKYIDILMTTGLPPVVSANGCNSSYMTSWRG